MLRFESFLKDIITRLFGCNKVYKKINNSRKKSKNKRSFSCYRK